MNLEIFGIAASACLSSLISSFLLRLFSSADAEDKPDFNEIIKTICFNILGCGVSSLITTRIGRKRALLVVDTLFCVSLIGAFPNYKEHGKGVLSFAMGISGTATPLYVSEATPRRYAFMSMFIFDVSVPLGGSLNYLIVLFFKRVRRLRIPFCFVLFCVYCFSYKNLCVCVNLQTGAFIFGFCLIILHFLIVFYLKETIPFLLKQV